MGCGCSKSELIDRRIRLGRKIRQRLSEEQSDNFSDGT